MIKEGVNTTWSIIVGCLVLLVSTSGFAQGNKPDAPPGEAGVPGPDVSPNSAAQAKRVIVRGWEIQSASAIKRPKIRDVFPVYERQQLTGKIATDRGSQKGEFVIVQVKCSWATTQPPVEPLWLGKPDAVLVDGSGNEYPAGGILVRDGTELVTPGMDFAEVREPNKRPGRNLNIILYFDAPRGPDYQLKVAEGVPLLELKNVNDLPVEAGEVP